MMETKATAPTKRNRPAIDADGDVKMLCSEMDKILRTAARMDHPASVLIVFVQEIAKRALQNVTTQR